MLFCTATRRGKKVRKMSPFLATKPEELAEMTGCKAGQWYTDAIFAMNRLEAHCNSSLFLQQGWFAGGREMVAEFRRRIEEGGLGETFPAESGWGEPERKWAAYWDRLRLTRGQALNDSVSMGAFTITQGNKNNGTDSSIQQLSTNVTVNPNRLYCRVRQLFEVFPWKVPTVMDPATGELSRCLAESVAFGSHYYKLVRVPPQSIAVKRGATHQQEGDDEEDAGSRDSGGSAGQGANKKQKPNSGHEGREGDTSSSKSSKLILLLVL